MHEAVCWGPWPVSSSHLLGTLLGHVPTLQVGNQVAPSGQISLDGARAGWKNCVSTYNVAHQQPDNLCA